MKWKCNKEHQQTHSGKRLSDIEDGNFEIIQLEENTKM